MLLPYLELEVRRSTDEMEGPIMSSTGDTWGWSFTTKIVWIAAAATLLTSWAGATAADERRSPGDPARVKQGKDPVSRDPVREAIERLPESEIKAFYLRCCREAAERLPSGGSTEARP